MKILCVLFGLALGSIIRADTLTLRSNVEINGKVEYEKDHFSIAARFRSGTKTFVLDRKEVLSVEVNNRDFNSGEPPSNVSMFETRTAATQNASESGSEKSEESNKKAAAASKGEGPKAQVLSPDNYDRSVSDVVLFRDKTRLIGRMTLMRKGVLMIQIGNASKQVGEDTVATLLVAPD